VSVGSERVSIDRFIAEGGAGPYPGMEWVDLGCERRAKRTSRFGQLSTSSRILVMHHKRLMMHG